MSQSILQDVTGGQELFDWFGRVPRFHDAEILEVRFSSNGSGVLRIRAWNMTDQVDAKGFYVLDRHAVVTMTLNGVTAVELEDFDMLPGIIGHLEVSRVGEQLRIAWDASYGAAGSIMARQLQIAMVPGKP